MLNISSLRCLSHPGALPRSLSALFFFQASSQTPLPSSDKCWEMKSKNTSEYLGTLGLVIANIFPRACQTKAIFQLFLPKIPSATLQPAFHSAVTIPTRLGFPLTAKIKGFLATEPRSHRAGHVPIDTGQNFPLISAEQFYKAAFPSQPSQELPAPSQLLAVLPSQITANLTFPCLPYLHSAQIYFLLAFKKTTELGKRGHLMDLQLLAFFICFRQKFR